MNYQNISLDVNDAGLATITLNRVATCNAFDRDLIDSLTDAIKFCAEQDAIRVIQLTANGKLFSAGADLNWMRDSMAMSQAENIDDAKCFAELLKRFKNCKKPTIVKINGPAYGGAIGLICCCDISVAVEESEYCFSEVKLGLIPATISPYVIAAIGEKAAKRYFMSAETISSEKAVAIGLIDERISADKIDDYCNNIINSILMNKPLAVNQAKQLVNTILALNKNDDIETITAKLIADIRVTAEAQTALTDFLHKHKTKKIPR